jgi:hypothetical protein
MKYFSTLLGNVCLFAFSVSAQHETDIWYFGTGAGLSFVSGTPVSLNDGETNTIEGTSVISDGDGNLIFYTDGVTVWDRNHDIMTNGTGLHGGTSSSQSALIIQLPDSDSLYYIFTTGEAANSYGLQYSIVDISLQNGDGEVIEKNVQLLSYTTEKLTAARHQNGTDYWILTHDLGNADYYAYLFNASGINTTPVISTTGTVHFDEIGYMKVSHGGKKIAVAVHSDFFFELCDFDNSTGLVSNAVTSTMSQPLSVPTELSFRRTIHCCTARLTVRPAW